MYGMAIKILLILLPWRLRRYLLQRLYHYELHPDSRIGLAWVFPRKLVMGAGARIDHLTVVKGLDRLALAETPVSLTRQGSSCSLETCSVRLWWFTTSPPTRT